MTALMVVALVAVQIADAVTTYIGLAQRGGVHEENAMVAKVMRRIGVVPALVLIKGGCAAATVWAALQPQCWVPFAVAAFIAVYVWAIRHNLKIIRGARG